ncbi:ricin-type beta-trefoil lectin domain protein, partial [Streptomyces sp. NPDC050433]
PFFLILNLAVGGYWPGDPNGSTPFPSTLTVDYVRVTTDGGGGTGGSITGLGGKCLDVAGANPANGTPVQLYDCNSSPAQQWSRGANDSLRALGKCLDVKDNSTADGAQLQLWDCSGAGNQRWAVSGANDVVNIQADKCMDATGNSSANGTRAQIWTCTGAPNQKWSVNA